jgi:hypothetical protein
MHLAQELTQHVMQVVQVPRHLPWLCYSGSSCKQPTTQVCQTPASQQQTQLQSPLLPLLLPPLLLLLLLQSVEHRPMLQPGTAIAGG